MLSNDTQREERTDQDTEFELVTKGDGRVFLKIFTGKGGAHHMHELSDKELADLRDAVTKEPDRV